MQSAPRRIPLWERIYCWILIVVGFAGGVLATYIALNNIFGSEMSVPCYLLDDASNITVSSSH